MITDISNAEARHIAVATQGLHLAITPDHDPATVLRDRGCIQIDTIAVVRRSHELVLLARGIANADAATYLEQPGPTGHFEHWGHAASLIPVEHWGWFAFRRRRFLSKGWTGPEVDPAAVEDVRAAVAERGAVTVTDLGGAQGSGWERTSPAKWAAEWLLATGELICVRRKKFSRVYEDAAKVLGDRQPEPSDDDCMRELCRLAMDALGVATADDVADYFRIAPAAARKHLPELEGLHAIRVEGWTEPAWATTAALTPHRIDKDAITPLSPFDSLLWHRPRAARLFGIDYLLEAYKPAVKRECGYFGMPVLHGTQIAGRIALRTKKGIAELEGHQLRPNHDLDTLWTAASTAAQWANALFPARPAPLTSRTHEVNA